VHLLAEKVNIKDLRRKSRILDLHEVKEENIVNIETMSNKLRVSMKVP